VSDKDQEKILDTLLQALTDRRKPSNGNLPAKYDGDSPLPVPQPKGFFARLFDPHVQLKEDYETKRLSVMLDTRIKALELEAQGYVDKVRIDQENKVRLHEHEVLQNEGVMKRYAEARAQILLHNLQQSLMTQVAELGLDPTEEQYLISKIVSMCMKTEKENPNGRK
jgi:hypothetical protein